MSGPYVTIDLEKIQANSRVITDVCAAHGIEVTGVTKVTCGMPSVARAMLAGGVTSIGESRMENIRRLKVSGINAPMMLLRIPPLSAVDEIVTSVDISLNSELSVIEALSLAAARRGIVHDIILMVDLGDLREGIWPDDLIPIVSEVVKLAGVRTVGIGTNLSCYGGIIPTCANMDELVYYADEIEGKFGVSLAYLSGGNSSSLSLIAEGGMPARINHVRIGEGMLLGRETVERRPWPGTSQDAFVLRAEVIELKEKPSVPIGQRGQDAFGGTPTFTGTASDHLEGARREMNRAILNVGREDVLVEGLEPIDSRLTILGASSDHLIVDVTRAGGGVALGGELEFLMNYGALLAAMTSSYVEKRPIMRPEDIMNMRGVAIIGVPSWVGAMEPGTDAAPRALRETGLAAKLASLGLTVRECGDVTVNESIRGDDYDENIREVAGIAAATADPVGRAISDGLVPLVLGGDHSAALGVLVGLSRVLHPFGLIWFDAHGDFTVPDGTGEARISRMVLGAALGYGDDRLRMPGARTPLVSPENIVIVGLRDVTQGESRLLAESGVTIFTMEDIDALGIKEVIYRSLRAAGTGTRGIHVSFDIDVVDVQTAPGVNEPVMGGITYRETHLAMELLAQSGLMRSMDVAGVNMEADPEGKTAHVAVEFILSAFGKKILGEIMRKPIDDTVVYLEQLGLTQYEAKVYLALLSEHPATAYTISRRSAVPHSRVYEVARRLMAKGYVVCQNTNPDRFSPLSPRELVGKLAGEHERIVAELKQRLDAIPFRSDFDPVWNINSREGALSKAREIIGEAQKKIYIGVWDEELGDLVDDLRTADGRGVEIVFLIYGTAPVDFGRAFYHDTTSIKEIAYLGRNVDIVADSSAAVSGWLGTETTNGEPKEGGDSKYSNCQVIWTKNRGLINVIEGYIIHDFYLAEILGVFRGEIEAVFGANMKALRDKYRG